METILFYYTLTVSLMSALTGAVCLSAYVVTHRRTYLFGTSAFIFYFFDAQLMIQNMFLAQATTDYFSVETPVLSVILGAGFFGSIWLSVCTVFGERRKALVAAPIIVFIVGSLAINALVVDSRWHLFLFYNMRALLMFWTLGYALVKYALEDDPVERLRLSRFRAAFAVLLVATAGVVAENVWTQLLVDPALLTDAVPAFFTERNFCENLLMLCCAVIACRGAVKTLSLRFENPPADERQSTHVAVEDEIKLYGKRCGLSQREEEVLKLVLEGKDNQNIASAMDLSFNTVKVHMHNILRKTNQANRQELIQDFWRGR